MSTPVVDRYVEELLNDRGHAFDLSMEGDASPATAATVPVAAAVPVAIQPPAPAPDISPKADHPAAPAQLPRILNSDPLPAMARVGIETSDTTTNDPRQHLAATHTSRWLRVGVGSDHYAFELLRVQEVVRVTPVVAMRGAAPAVLGVMNLRGRIVPVFDLGQWLNTPAVVTDEHSRIVVVERDDELIGVLVTCVEDVATLQPSTIEPPIAGTRRGTIVGIARVARVPTVLLDANALFD